MSKKAAKTKPALEPTVLRDCAVELSAEQIADRAREMTDLMTAISEAEQAQKDEHKRRAIIIAGLKSAVSTLHHTIQSGRELQPVKCRVEKDFELGNATITRIDTGEVVETRGLTEEEKQPKLGLMIQLPPPPPPKEIDVRAAVESVGPVPDRPQPKLTEAQQLQADEAKWTELQARAVEIISETKRASVSTIQRRLPCGSQTAFDLMDALEARGIVGPPRGQAPREIIQLPEAAPTT